MPSPRAMSILIIIISLSASANGLSFTPNQLVHLKAVGLAHGIISCLAWVIFAPVGAILLRCLPAPYALRAHAIWQTFTYCVYTSAVGMGLWLAITIERVNWYHPIIGLIVFGLATIQLFGGPLAHITFKKSGRPTAWGMLHACLGVLTVLLGTINGGLGLLYNMHVSPSEFIPYAVLASIIWVCFVGFLVASRVKRAKAGDSERVALETEGAGAGERAFGGGAAEKDSSDGAAW